MAEGKLGLGMGEQDKRVEELEDILKWVMKSVDDFLDGDDFEHDEVNRALLMNHKIKNLLIEKDDRIQSLRGEVQRLESNLSYAYQYICLLKGDHYG